MASATGEGSSLSPPVTIKPVIVRVKRKTVHSPLEGFWLEINERPLKKPLLDFAKLSISESSSISEGLKKKKVFVQHVETSTNSEAIIDIVQSFLSDSTDVLERKRKQEERRHAFKKDNRQARQDQRLSKAIQNQETSAKNAHFEQIWRSRKGTTKGMPDEALHEKCQFYDIIRVDNEGRLARMDMEELSLEDQKLLSSYLPLLEEHIPAAAAELASDIRNYMSRQDDEYVYDYYAVNDDMDVDSEDLSNPFPLVQVDDDDFYNVPDALEHDSDDSNAEDNPLNDYPDEISEDEVDESETTEDSDEEEDEDSEEESENEESSHRDPPKTSNLLGGIYERYFDNDDDKYDGAAFHLVDDDDDEDDFSDYDASELEDRK